MRLSVFLSALFAFFFVLPAHAATCENTTTNDQILEIAARGERAFADQDRASLDRIFPEANHAVQCLGEKVSADAAAAFHRLFAISHLYARNEQGLLAELAAARRLNGDYSYERALDGTTGHPLSRYYDRAADFDGGDPITIRVETGHTHAVGGVIGASWSPNLPGILQELERVEGGDMTVIRTSYLSATDDLPAWAQVAPAVTLPTEPLTPVRNSFLAKPGVQWALAGVLYAGAGASCASAAGARSTFQDPSTSMSDLSGLETRANFSGASCATLGVVAVVPTVFAIRGTRNRASATSSNP